MKERPILFSAAMIKAILAGSKSQTRRVLKPQPPTGFEPWGSCENGNQFWIAATAPVSSKQCNPHELYKPDGKQCIVSRCPYGQPGSTLWIRESFWWGHAPNDQIDQGIVRYDDGSALTHPALLPERRSWAREYRRKPAMYMPRWASRITLEVVSMRVERLGDIWHSPADLLAEGVTLHYGRSGTVAKRHGCDMLDEARDLFVELWDHINGKRGYPWASSPWVWVIEFRRIQP